MFYRELTRADYKKMYKQNLWMYGVTYPRTFFYRCAWQPFHTPMHLVSYLLKLTRLAWKRICRKCRAGIIRHKYDDFSAQHPGMKVSDFIKPIALYLPQFHRIPENDAWWGEGFTEWTNVRKAKPLFPGHYQPHVPHPDVGYYDLSDVEVMRKQANMAKEYGIHGFCFYYYHFANGKRLLEKPLNNWLAAKDIDFPFCYAWANENWTRAWDGEEKEVIMPQEYDEGNMVSMLEEMFPAFEDERYMRVEGKPVLLVYRAEIIPDVKKITELWRRRAKENDLPGLYLVSMQNFEEQEPGRMGFDAAVEFAPQNRENIRVIRRKIISPSVVERSGSVCWNMEDVVDMMTCRVRTPYPRLKCVCPSWDNTARRQENGSRVCLNATPALFEQFYRAAVKESVANGLLGNGMLFINAWNEWAEGAHLEPDEKNGYAWLRIVQDTQNTPLSAL